MDGCKQKSPVTLFRTLSVPIKKNKTDNKTEEKKSKANSRDYLRTNSDTRLNTRILQLSVLELLHDGSRPTDACPKATNSQGWINQTKPDPFCKQSVERSTRNKAEVTSDPVSVADQIAMMPMGPCRSDSEFTRQISESSVGTTKSDGRATCRICWEVGADTNPMVTPCLCAGSAAFVHLTCLEKWLIAAEIRRCEVCKHPFKMQRVMKPLKEWRWFPPANKIRTQLWITIIILFIVTPPVACGVILCVEKLGQSLEQPENLWKMAGLVFLGLISICLYSLLMVYCCCKTCVVWRTWIFSNQTITIHPNNEDVEEGSVPVPLRESGYQYSISRESETTREPDLAEVL